MLSLGNLILSSEIKAIKSFKYTSQQLASRCLFSLQKMKRNVTAGLQTGDFKIIFYVMCVNISIRLYKIIIQKKQINPKLEIFNYQKSSVEQSLKEIPYIIFLLIQMLKYFSIFIKASYPWRWQNSWINPVLQSIFYW